jgi:hypothetical protein
MSDRVSPTATRLCSELAIGQWFRPPFSGSELWLLVWSDGRCLRFGPDRFEGPCLISYGGGMRVEIELPWFDIIRRLQPTSLGKLTVGSWFEWAGQPLLVVGEPGGYMAFDPLLWTELPDNSVVVPLEVQIRTDKKSWRRWLGELLWWT